MTALLERDGRQGLDTILTAAELEYARLLFSSGYGAIRIADVLGLPYALIANVAERRGWTHRTPVRRTAAIGWRVPVLVRCQDCSARFGEELGKARPCPHCGSTTRDAA